MRLLNFPPALREAVELQIQRLQTRSQFSANDDGVRLLSNEKTSPPDLPRYRLLNEQYRRTGILVFVAGLLLIVLAASYPGKRSPTPEIQIPGTKWSPGEPKAEDHYLQIILPTQLNTTESCKTLLTGSVLNYPSPWVVNWQPRLDEQGNVVDTNFAKLESIFRLMKDKSPKHENDTVIVLANPNTWFQLRPEVLLTRYWESQHKEAATLKRKYGEQTFRTGNMTPKVLITAQNACQSMQAQGSGCIAVQAPDKSPRYVGHDLLIGKYSDVRDVYRQAVNQAKAAIETKQPWDEHSIFAHIFSRQETHRQTQTKRQVIATSLSDHELHRKDFGLFIDFSGSLSYTSLPNNQSDEISWVHYDPSKGAPKGSLPKDIASSPPPFWTIFSKNPERESQPWTSVPFLMNKSRNQIPALIQRSTSSDPALSSTLYSQLWFHPHGRELLNNFAFTFYVPSAIIKKDKKGGKEQRFWPPIFAKPGFETDDNKFHKWNNQNGNGLGICDRDHADAEQIFLDGKGPWRDPRP